MRNMVYRGGYLKSTPASIRGEGPGGSSEKPGTLDSRAFKKDFGKKESRKRNKDFLERGGNPVLFVGIKK